jgi:hypothetical protein
MAWTDERQEAIRLWRGCENAASLVGELEPSIARNAVILFPNPPPLRRVAKSIARPIEWLRSCIGARVRVFPAHRQVQRLSPKRAVLAPTFRFRLLRLRGARRAHPMSQRRGGPPLPMWNADQGCENAYRSGSLARLPEKGERATRPVESEGPMSLRIAIRACRRALALSEEAEQATQQLPQEAKAAR